jgi:hypothetical protein
MHRRTALVALLMVISCRADDVPGHLGRSREDYSKVYGEAVSSPMTPNQLAFTVAADTRLIVRFADGRSAEELWLLGAATGAVPSGLAARAQRLIQSGIEPVRIVTFKMEGVLPAQVFERPMAGGKLIAERRGDRLEKVALCADASQCRLLDFALKRERDTDSLLSAAADALRGRR